MPTQLTATTPDGALNFHFHRGQWRAWESAKRFILVLAGTQSGKTSFGPPWLWREIKGRGPGDYIGAAPTFPLMNLKMLPEFLGLFQHTLRLGDYNASARRFAFSPDGCRTTFGHVPDVPTHVYFGHAQDPDSLESATAKAAWLDEAGQKKFKVGSREAVVRRLSIHQGRALITTTPYCYDEDMEIYTRKGWKTFGQLTAADEVLACRPTGEAHFEKPSRIIWEHYSGPMYAFKGGRIDLFVTPNHRILYRNSARFYTRTAEEFAGLSHRSLVIPKTIRLGRDGPAPFTLPPVEIGHRWGPRLSAAVEIPMPDWCAFFGWFLSEGCVRGCAGGKITRSGYRVDLSQNGGAKKDRMRADLARLPFRWSEHANGFTTSNKQLWSYLSAFGGSGEKYVPPEVKAANLDALRLMIDRMILGDGTYRADRKGEFVYYTTSRRLAEDFREVCMLTGVSTHIAERENVTGGANVGGRAIVSGRPIYHVNERKRQGGIVQSCEVVPYSGHVGCVTVSTGYVLARRNGEECIYGNSLGWLKQRLWDP